MSSTLHSLEKGAYESVVWHESRTTPGVRFAVRRISLGQRINLNRRIREVMRQHEFLKAGDTLENMDAAMLELLADKLYLEWGVADVEGLRIDGEVASVTAIAEKGPEALSAEMIEVIQRELALTREEEKNS